MTINERPITLKDLADYSIDMTFRIIRLHLSSPAIEHSLRGVARLSCRRVGMSLPQKGNPQDILRLARAHLAKAARRKAKESGAGPKEQTRVYKAAIAREYLAQKKALNYFCRYGHLNDLELADKR